MKAVKIERPSKEDALKIHDFFDLVIRDTFIKNGLSARKEIVQEEKTYKRSCLRQDYESDGKDRYFLIAKVGSKVVGTIEYGPSNEIIRKAEEGLLSIKEVGTVYVHPKYQRQGIGRKLLNAIGKALMNEGYEYCVLDSGYPEAQKIWKGKFGDPYILLKNYWGEGYDHMIWRPETSSLLDANEDAHKLRMAVVEQGLSVCRMDREAKIPHWVWEGTWSSVTKTDDELSIVCDTALVDANVDDGHIIETDTEIKVEKGWRVLKVLGPLDFVMIGILAAIADNLAEEGISIFAISTYDTDYVLIKEAMLKRAIHALMEDDRILITNSATYL